MKERRAQKVISSRTGDDRARDVKPFAIQQDHDGKCRRVPLHELDLDAAAFVLVGVDRMRPKALSPGS